MNGRARTPLTMPGSGLVRALLHWAASPGTSDTGGLCLPAAWDSRDDRQLQHIVDGGLAPLLHHAAGDSLQHVPLRWRDDLAGAALTAHFAHAAIRESAIDVIDICAELGVPVTLLKGISISDQYWPAPHLRPMGDVDVLLPEAEAARVEAALRERGFAPMPHFDLDEGDAHGTPLLDTRRQIWIEPHTALFPRHARVNAGNLFGAVSVSANSIASTLDGRSILRLGEELQLVYIASYWLRDIRRQRLHATLLIPLLDAIFLLKASAGSLDWDALVDSLDNEMATASLYVLLDQVARHGLCEAVAPVMPRLAAAQRIVGGAELRFINRILDACLVEGRQFMGTFGSRHPMIESTVVDTLLTPGSFAGKIATLPWNFIFPPRVAERYSVRYHAQRIARFFKRAGGVT